MGYVIPPPPLPPKARKGPPEPIKPKGGIPLDLTWAVGIIAAAAVVAIIVGTVGFAIYETITK